MDDHVPTCRVCGCTDEQACAGGCTWVEDPQSVGDLCSSCLPLVRLVRDGVRAELRRPPVTVNVNLVADVQAMNTGQIDHLFRGLAKLREATGEDRVVTAAATAAIDPEATT